jgi:beta-lactamase class A
VLVGPDGVEHYPPPEQWTDESVAELIRRVPEAVRYNATLKYLRDHRDTGTPKGTVAMLARAFQGEILSQRSTANLINILKATTTFPTRLKGALPAGTVVAHKTGSIETVKGLTAATNDSVIFLPDGSQLAVSVYFKASTRNDAERDKVIARTSLGS